MRPCFRVGQGFDAHRFVRGRPLVLCGVEVQCEVGLEGHSDADVALHAVTDAVLGAAAAGDLGLHFPPTEERWQGMPSQVFLERALELAAGRGLVPVNCDLTILGERPQIAPHREALRASLAGFLRVPLDAVSVKATSTEGLGWLGRREGLAAMAVVLLGPDDD